MSIEAVDELRRNARSVIRELGLLNDAYFEIGVNFKEFDWSSLSKELWSFEGLSNQTTKTTQKILTS